MNATTNESLRLSLSLPLSLLLMALAGCVQYGEETTGLARTPQGDGPRVTWDLAARPLPEIPFPNDAATFPDPDSPTGRRVNASLVAPTRLEAEARAKIDRLDGFGIYAPITVSFEAPLDLASIRAAMRADDGFSDDVLYLVNLNPASPRYGQPSILDVGNGNFPVVLEKTSFFDYDERAGESNLVFETVDEVALGQDTNHDGDLDVPNVLNEGDDTEREIMTFYERETDTLMVRPLLPLDEQSTYAVVLTKRLRGVDGSPVRSPFEFVHDLRQTRALKPLVEDGILASLGLGIEDVAFAWTFSTQSTTADLVAIRRGLDGWGPFDGLGSKYPAVLSSIDLLKDAPSANGSMHVLDASLLVKLIDDPLVGTLFGNEARRQALKENYAFVDYFVTGSFEGPWFVTEDGTWHVNPKTGEYQVGSDQVTWAMAVPKQTAKYRAPFDLQIHLHGYTSSRLELIFWAGSYCRFGSAVVAVDAAGHGGGVIDSNTISVVQGILAQNGILNSQAIFQNGRSRDLNGDGDRDSGGDFWTSDTFHTRDMVRQSVVDVFQLVRVFRAFDGVQRWQFDLDGDGENELAGDFNADGVVDAGGPWASYRMSGGSLGGILSAIAAAAEPYIDHTVSVSGAAGLPDVAIRSTQGGVNEAVVLRILGPLVIAYPDEDAGNAPTLGFHVPDVNDDVRIPFAALGAAQPGDRVEVRNLTAGESEYFVLSTNLTGRAGVPADAGDRVEVVVYEGSADGAAVRHRIQRFDRDAEYQQTEWESGDRLVFPTEGYGLDRQSPEMRRFLTIAGMVTEPGDPVAWARHIFLEPLPILKEGPRAHNILIIPTIGDTAVPVSTGIANARAAGLIPVTLDEARDPDFRYGRAIPWDPSLGYAGWHETRKSWDEWRTAIGSAWSPQGLEAPRSPNDVLLENWVIEGIERLRRFEHDPRFQNADEILFDVDDLADGLDPYGQPRIAEPLRITRRTSAGISAMRIPYLDPKGSHGFGLYEPDSPFDMPTYMHSLIGQYISTEGEQLIEALCNEDASCEYVQQTGFDLDGTAFPGPLPGSLSGSQ